MPKKLAIFPATGNDNVSEKVAAQIRKMLLSGNRYFGSAGASLTHQIYDTSQKTERLDAKKASVGLTGERETTTRLLKWMKKYPNAVLCDSVHVNLYNGEPDPDYTSEGEEDTGEDELDEELGYVDSRKDSDHILIVGHNVFVIDSKRWRKKSMYCFSPKYRVLRNNKHFKGGEVHMNQALGLWRKYLQSANRVFGVIVIENEEVSTFRNREWYKAPFKLLDNERFNDWLDEQLENFSEKDLQIIDPNLVAEVAVSCIKPYSVYNSFIEKANLGSDFF